MIVFLHWVFIVLCLLSFAAQPFNCAHISFITRKNTMIREAAQLTESLNSKESSGKYECAQQMS